MPYFQIFIALLILGFLMGWLGTQRKSKKMVAGGRLAIYIVVGAVAIAGIWLIWFIFFSNYQF